MTIGSNGAAITIRDGIPVWCFMGRDVCALTDDEAGHLLPVELGPWTFHKRLTMDGSRPDEAEAIRLIRDHGFCCFDPLLITAES
ncbi:hypothetical protein [Sphingomonas sp. BAUL-RG-20F-R05-02]|uniref:hypothetical protein n=1 Tax=Sphingomonas sp. BAUL-RG-20F-R05-02 TaxID=2914830 RepID=UPI001F598185|nr:hypothetical protein [Sphingomonas sp. BAUL-RG-20F-R05-02]